MAEDEVKRAPLPTNPDEFGGDERISYDRVTGNYMLEDERGETWEFSHRISKWVPVMDDAQIARMQEIYDRPREDKPEGEEQAKKRKAAAEEDSTGNAKKTKTEQAPRKNNAVYVTSLPLDADEEEIKEVFQKYGIIAESVETNKPRIKLYTDDEGNFKGDALIVYFRPESVVMAIEMLDETDFRLGEKLITGPMRVSEADQSYKSQKEQPLKSEEAKVKGTGANRDRSKVIKKNEELNARLADWDDDDPSTLQQTSNRWDKIVVLKHMFKPEALEKNPEEILEIKEDVREECEKIGTVTNVVLYDKEEEGVVTVRFADSVAARASVKVFNGRIFDGQKVEAYVSTSKEKFKKSKKQEGDKEEAARLESYSKFIEGEED